MTQITDLATALKVATQLQPIIASACYHLGGVDNPPRCTAWAHTPMLTIDQMRAALDPDCGVSIEIEDPRSLSCHPTNVLAGSYREYGGSSTDPFFVYPVDCNSSLRYRLYKGSLQWQLVLGGVTLPTSPVEQMVGSYDEQPDTLPGAVYLRIIMAMVHHLSPDPETDELLRSVLHRSGEFDLVSNYPDATP